MNPLGLMSFVRERQARRLSGRSVAYYTVIKRRSSCSVYAALCASCATQTMFVCPEWRECPSWSV